MKKISLTIACLFLWATISIAQNTFETIIVNHDTEETLVGATIEIEGTELGGVSDINGKVLIENIPNGHYHLHISYVGYQEVELEVVFPLIESIPQIGLEEGEELDVVTVTTTRSGRNIEDIPTRLELINAEEMAEKAVMNSTNISILLRESTGIQVQQTSASSANQSIRIQGLDGRYTQLLKDGFPIYGGFSSGLSIMQIPPLDLEQVEVVKGSSSTLYGGGAIAGLVNLISKTPEEDPTLDVMFSQTQALGSTLNAFYAQQYGKLGLSLYSSGHFQKAYDNNNDDFSDLPQTKSIGTNANLFYNFDDKTKLRVGLNTSFEDRWGGDMSLITNGEPSGEHQYSERNYSKRLASQVRLDRKLGGNMSLVFKNSINFFDRELIIPTLSFQGTQIASYSELNVNSEGERAEWVLGANMWTDKFDERNTNLERDFSDYTLGLFGQNTFTVSDYFSIESGLRTDYHSEYGVFVLPRLNLLFDINKHWTARLGGGMGYKTPTMFTEEGETRAYQDIVPLSPSDLEAERSIGGNLDINYKTVLFDKVSFNINNLFFYTRLNKPLFLRGNILGQPQFQNSTGFVDSKGLETNMKFTYKDYKLFLNYALIDAQLKESGVRSQKPLTPKHNIGAVLMYETDKWRIGYETYYTGAQSLSDGSKTNAYWLMGFMLLRTIKDTDIYINFENFTDTRQSRYSPIVNSEHASPIFSELWAPTDGFIFTAGVKFHLFGKEHHH